MNGINLCLVVLIPLFLAFLLALRFIGWIHVILIISFIFILSAAYWSFFCRNEPFGLLTPHSIAGIRIQPPERKN